MLHRRRNGIVENYLGLLPGPQLSCRSIAALIPLWFAPGEAYQFDWSHEIVVLGGVTTTIKVAHTLLAHPYREELLPFLWGGGVCQRALCLTPARRCDLKRRVIDKQIHGFGRGLANCGTGGDRH